MNQEQSPSWKKQVHRVIFGVDTPAGKLFDVILIWAIILSIIVVMLDSVKSIHYEYGPLLLLLEWVFTIVFTIEYILRLICVPRPSRYAKSFFGLVDLLSILPTYLSVFIVGSQSLLVIRTLRLLRIFRVFKLAQFSKEAYLLLKALRSSREKILVFILSVMTLVTVAGSLMYLIEGEANGFTSIPRGIYWAIVTMTTVGYGDITPQTVPGQMLASIMMICGYGIIAVPTGIFSVELAQAHAKERK